jgi:hypothetical protein
MNGMISNLRNWRISPFLGKITEARKKLLNLLEADVLNHRLRDGPQNFLNWTNMQNFVYIILFYRNIIAFTLFLTINPWPKKSFKNSWLRNPNQIIIDEEYLVWYRKILPVIKKKFLRSILLYRNVIARHGNSEEKFIMLHE